MSDEDIRRLAQSRTVRELIAWLDAAISNREEAARDAARIYGPRWGRPVDTDMVRVSDDIWFQALSDEIAEHVVCNSPESVLRRCAADRKLLDLHRPVVLRGGGGARYFETTTVCKSCEPPKQFPETAYPCPTVVPLAEGYGWTGGER